MATKGNVIKDWIASRGDKEIQLRVNKIIEDYVWRRGVDKSVDSSVVEEEEFTG